MRLVEQWRAIEEALPEGWTEAELRLTVDDWSDYERAAALLAPLTPGRSRRSLRFSCVRRGTGPGPAAVRDALRRLDSARIGGELELVASREAAPAQPAPRESLAAAWDEALAALPADWSDLYVELAFRSSDHVERAALLCSPLNPTRPGDRPALRFRVARRFGYGASPEMTRRCLERLDAAGLRGTVTILHALADTRPVGTQGPVWYVEGKAV